MNPTLYVVSPEWNSRLDFFILATRDSFQLKILTEKSSDLPVQKYQTILECFESYSPYELSHLLRLAIKDNVRHFHFIFPDQLTPKRALGLTLLAGYLAGLLQSHLSYSDNDSKISKSSILSRALHSIVNTKISYFSTPPFLTPLTNSNDICVYDGVPKDQKIFIFPDPDLLRLPLDLLSFLKGGLSKSKCQLEIWNWSSLPLSRRNQIRNFFGPLWTQIQFQTPRSQIELWGANNILTINSRTDEIKLTEIDLVSLTLLKKVRLFFFDDANFNLRGPWSHQENCFFWSQMKRNLLKNPFGDEVWSLFLTNPTSLQDFATSELNNAIRQL